MAGLAGGLADNGGLPSSVVSGASGAAQQVPVADGAGSYVWTAYALAQLSDTAVSTPSDGQIAAYNASTGKWTNTLPSQYQASGPGGTAGASSGAALSIPDPRAFAGFGLYWAKLTANCTVTLPSPATIGSKFVGVFTQDATGGRTLAFAGSPPIVFPGPSLNLNTQANAENWIEFYCRPDNGGNPTWYAFPGTSSLVDSLLQMCKVAALSNVASILTGTLPTINTYAVQEGDRVLLTAQSTASQNGPWIAHAASTWVRPADYPTTGALTAAVVPISSSDGTNPSTLWYLSATAAVVVDTTATTWVKVGPAPTAPAQVASFTSSNAAWPIPGGATKLIVRAVGGGGGGGGAGTVATGTAQAGGGGGGAGTQASRVFSVSSSTHLNITIGGAGAGGGGGAAGANTGTVGTSGGSTTVVGDGADGITVTAPGGAGGAKSSATSNGQFGGGARGGAAAATAGAGTTATASAASPGAGGANGISGAGQATGGSPDCLSGGGGGGGASSSTTNGGNGGGAGTLAAGGAAGSGTTGSTTGANGGTAAANTGAGGGGGGGGTNNTGVGGTGGNGGSGYVEVEVYFT